MDMEGIAVKFSKKKKSRNRVTEHQLLDEVPDSPRLEDFVDVTAAATISVASVVISEEETVAAADDNFDLGRDDERVDLETLHISSESDDRKASDKPEEGFSGSDTDTVKSDSFLKVSAPENAVASCQETVSLYGPLPYEESCFNVTESDSESVDPCEEVQVVDPSAPCHSNSALFSLDSNSYASLQQTHHPALYPALTNENIPDSRSLLTNHPAAINLQDSLSSGIVHLHVVPQALSYDFSTSQIQSMYNNLLLEDNEANVNEFLQSVKTSYDGFELYELLCNYLRAYTQLAGCRKTLNAANEACTEFEKILWSISSENLCQSSLCQDGNQVVATHSFHVAKFDSKINRMIGRNLQEVKELVKDSFSLFTYSVELCKIQINHFFHKSFKDINLQSFEVQSFYSEYPNGSIESCAQLLRLCVSTLFIFVRKHISHPSFLRDVYQWISQCVGLLLRIATFKDHIFILNHVVRCPPGVIAKNVVNCVQIPIIPIPHTASDYFQSGFGHLNLDYALTVLSTILNPVSKRGDFVKIADIPVQISPSDAQQWVVVDSDGEDDPEDSVFFKESDIVSLLQQIPFDHMFRRMLLVYTKDGSYQYDVNLVSEASILKALAFGTQLVNILGQGFISYYTDRYRQLVKMLGRLILHCVQYITDHLDCMIKSDKGIKIVQGNALILREYDLFFRTAVGVLFSGKNIGTLQFLAALPYHLISTEMLWHIYCGMTKWTGQETRNVVTCPEISSEFENELVSMNESDAFYLLTTFSNMGIAREAKEADFIKVVTLHLFQIGFLSKLTRDSCSKTARDLLGNLTRKYSQLISVLLQVINSKMQILEQLSLYLLKELAFENWKPADADLKLLSKWLTSYSPPCIENQMGRFVLQTMNWDFDDTGELFLPFDIHMQAGLMIMESHAQWNKSQNILYEGIKQVNALTNRNQDNWSWDMIMRLHLHGLDRSNLGHLKLSGILRSLPTFESNADLECIRKGLEIKDPLACLLALYLTPMGHSVPILCSKGLELIEIMAQNYRLDHVIHALFFVTPLFAGSIDELCTHEKFRGVLTSLVTADMTYMRMAKSLITSDFPGTVTMLFGYMISAHLDQAYRFGLREKRVMKLWLLCLTKLENWNKDNNVLYLLDVLAKFSLTNEGCNDYFKDFFSSLYKEIPSQSQSGIASLFSWSTPLTTLLPNQSYSQMPYLFYYILCIESELEDSSGFWKSMCASLCNPKISLDSAVKKSSSSNKFATATNYLTIFRFAQLALDIPTAHELQFLVWQKFFNRYFYRIQDASTTETSTVTLRFFEGIINSAFLSKLRKKVLELLQHTREEMSSYETKASSRNDCSENPTVMNEFLKERIKLAEAAHLWINDTSLLQNTLYLPALAPQFLPALVLSLIDNETVEWRTFVNEDQLVEETRNDARKYIKSISRNSWFEVKKIRYLSGLQMSESSLIEDIFKRFDSYDKPLKPPPVPCFEDVVSTVFTSKVTDITSLKSVLGPHFKELVNFSKSFSLQISQIMALNCAYNESLPELYSNIPSEIVVNVRCNGTKEWDGCSGPARVMFKYTEAKLNESLGHQIHQNRTEYQNVMDEKGTKPPPSSVCVASVVIEDFITNLVLEYRNCPENVDRKAAVLKVGIDFFYLASSFLNNETEFYPPTRQLFSSMLEVLGREFVSLDSNQSFNLVDTCIKNPRLIGCVAPHLNLATCSSSILLEIYSRVINIPKRDIDLTFVILTKLDINNWLRKSKPLLKDRSALVALIWKALTTDGITPSSEKMMVHDSYRFHLKSMLLHEFPQHYGEILTYILQGIEQRSVSSTIWYDFCNGLSKDTVRFFNGMDPFVRKREVKRFATEGSILSHQEVVETAVMLAQYFTKERLMHGIYGLYSKYRTYVEPISCLLQMVGYSVVASALKNSKGMLSPKIVEVVWPLLRDLYAPWILPYNSKFIQQNCAQWIQQMNFDSSTLLQPWIGTDSPLALVIMNDFTDSVMFLVEALPGTPVVFCYLWNFYVEHYAQVGIKEHVLGVIHNCFVTIPWATFWPTFSDVELMCRVVEKFLPVCHSFLSVVFAQISWLEWINNLSPGLLSKSHGMLLNLTIRLANDTVARESPTWIQVMERAESRINWAYVSPGSLEPILNWFVMSIDPRVVLKLETIHRMDAALIKLLKTVCGFVVQDSNGCPATNYSSNIKDSNTKRYYFTRSYVRLIVSASSKYKSLLETHPKSFESAIQDIVSSIVVVWNKEGQAKEAYLSHMRELLGLMCNHSLGTISRNAMIEWCKMNNDPPIDSLLVMINLCYGLKVPAYVIVPLLETLTNLYFKRDEARWNAIDSVAAVNPEELPKFFEVSTKDGHYLVLYTLFLKRYSQLVNGGPSTISFLMDCLKDLKPKQSHEEALPLIYGVILKCIIQTSMNVQESPDELASINIKKFLLAFSQHLLFNGDDKQGWGLLGALGIGKASQLSVKGRLFARSLGTFLIAQVPTNAPVRVRSDAEGHFTELDSAENAIKSEIKPHPEIAGCLEKLEGLKINRQYSDLLDSIDTAITFIREPKNALSQSDALITLLSSQLFSARYLIQH